MNKDQRTFNDTITLLHTNDIHSHFENMGILAAIANDYRERYHPEQVVLLDMGDHMDRMSLETEGSDGAANVDILNLTGYDAITIGNNEGLTYTTTILNQTYAGIVCPIVCSNVIEHTTGLPPVWMDTHRIIEKGGWTIGLVGATAPYGDFYELLGWDVEEPLNSLAPLVHKLRGEVDLLVLMSHLGLAADQRLAEQLPELDVILGGHSHHVLERPLWIGETVIGAAGKFGHYMGHMCWQKGANGGRAKLLDGGLIPTGADLMPRDEQIEAAIALHRERAAERMSRTVAILKQPLEIDYEHESPLGNLLAQAVRRYTGTELSIVNAGQLLGSLPAGEISEALLHRLCPSPINPSQTLLQGRSIRLALEQSLLEEFTSRAIMGFGFRGKVLGCLCVDGLTIRYDPNRPPYERIVSITTTAGEPLDDEREYSVGTLDMFTFRIGYESLSESTSVSYMLSEFIRDLLRTELQMPGAIDVSAERRWFML
ncbi:bifunctional UDP-sugar hydrolase/5'-nucleotidase [Paenibacillus campi]|uniref:bifunctional metallophosphatase/5'-nucleotidase n=1 Tax=Paenibacillus campi TaxID=3106031 RepID=UPI002AFF1DC2|nr:bifunctional UDP-sugar hydrolase/5'-nucleotidase [Paenibacillus sp. SGZ-1014]